MGAWGTGINSNDTYADIYEQFIDLYNEGLAVPEITKRFINENQETINLPEDATNFWFALANVQWECKALDNDILSKVDHIIKTGEDLRVWKELDASSLDLKAREKVLIKFLAKLQTEKEKPRKRKRKVLRDSIFQKGDCLTFRLDNDNFGGAFVLTSEKQTEYGMNLIAITTINQKDKPIIDDFKKASVLFIKEQFGLKGYQDREMISWCYAQFYKRKTVDFEVVGQISVEKAYDFSNDYRSVMQWDMIKTTVDRNEEFIKLRGKPDKALRLKRLYKKHGL